MIYIVLKLANAYDISKVHHNEIIKFSIMTIIPSRACPNFVWNNLTT